MGLFKKKPNRKIVGCKHTFWHHHASCKVGFVWCDNCQAEIPVPLALEVMREDWGKVVTTLCQLNKRVLELEEHSNGSK